jgi:Xaa-Pro aminopeptidase
MFIKSKRFTTAELDRFKTLQETCFGIQVELAGELEPGMSEREVAVELFQRYRAAGAGNFFHLPVALFGPRTGLPGRWGIREFFPRDV